MIRPVAPALHKKFSWLPAALENNREAEFIADSLDAWRGVETCLNLVNSSELDRANNTWEEPADQVSPLLNIVDSERLMRLAIITARTWELKCEERLQSLCESAEKSRSDAAAIAGGSK